MAKTVKEFLQEPNKVVIDVRTAEEVALGTLEGALTADLLNGDFEKLIPDLDSSKLYLLFCRSGGRSGMAADLLIQNGFKNVVNIGGYDDIKSL